VYFANVGDSKATVVRLEEEEEEEERENDENDANVRARGKNKDNNNTPTRASSRRQSLSHSNRSTPVKQRSTTPARKRQQLKTTNSDHAKNNSKVFFETPDQRPAREDERTRINNIGGKILKSRDGSARVEGILAVTRAFGNAGIKQFVEAVPEIFEFPIEHCGTVVLCTDGVTDVMNTEDVSSLVAKTIEDDKRARIERRKRRMSLNNNEVATKNGRNSRLGSPHKDLTLRNERTSSETLTSVSIKRRSRDNVTAVVFRCSQNLSSFDYILAETTTTTTTAAHIHSAIVNHVRTVPTSPVLSPIKTDLSKGGVESDELAVHLRESVQAISAANTPSPNKKKKAKSISSPNSPLPLPLSSNKKQKKKATEPKATKNTKSPLGVLKKEEVRSPTLNA
jgi:protein phosphatase 1L